MANNQKPASQLTFLDYAVAQSIHLRHGGRFGYAQNLRNASNRFRAYLTSIGRKDISFARLKPALVCSFEVWLRQQHVCRNTSSSYMRSLHTAFNQAVREGVVTVGAASGRSRVCANPFINVYCGVDKTRKRAIDKEDIRHLQELDIRDELMKLYRKSGKRPYGKYFDSTLRQLELYRDMFIFSFCMRGMAFVDIAFLRKSDISDDHILYARHKTRQRICVRVEPMMQAIIDRWPTEGAYLFPILTEENDESIAYQQYRNKLTLCNRRLRTLGQMLGGIPLTSYVSRHSWASTAHAENIPISIISQSMGHDSEHTTRIYLQELDSNVLDNANGSLLNTVFEMKNNKKHRKSVLHLRKM